MSSHMDELNKAIFDIYDLTDPEDAEATAILVSLENQKRDILFNHVDEIQQLWEATEPYRDSIGFYICPACGEGRGDIEHAPDCPREILRWIFGDMNR